MLSTTDRMPHDRMDRADDSDPSMPKEWGPLAGLADEWEGEGGLDTAFSHPFHTEVGYWLWDAATGEVVRGFVVPSGITVLAGGTADAGVAEFTLSAELGHPQYPIGENRYLTQNAGSLTYRVTITVGTGTWSYDETTMPKMNEFETPFPHTDHNTLHRAE
jgi:hypothetical protein